ncbi:MAG: archaetidylserine decarboxylase [Bacteroidales bacterium]|jgi:phosphatidylserine decarboxylase|nr:archaetidylserine decarboxylase [Bacteroidales bacterium]
MSQKKHKQNYRNKTSRATGSAANWTSPKWLVRYAINKFIKTNKISLSEYIVPEKGFKTFNDFFTRKIKPELRPIENGLVSPVDGEIFDFGYVNHTKKIFVKGTYFYVNQLTLEEYSDKKSFCVFYLAPNNYHRVHACFDMIINKIQYVPGTLFPVKEKSIQKNTDVYCRNERIILSGESNFGDFQFIFVGAFNVGKIKLSFDSCQSNIKKAKITTYDYKDTPIIVKKGEEVGYFEMGSSVILLLDNENLYKAHLEIKQKIKMGETVIR